MRIHFGRVSAGHCGRAELTRLAARKGLALDVKAPPAGASGFTPIWPLYKIEHAFAQLGPVAPPVALLRG